MPHITPFLEALTNIIDTRAYPRWWINQLVIRGQDRNLARNGWPFSTHIHFVAKPGDLPQEAKGLGIFSYLNVDQQSAVPPDEIKALCEELKEALSTRNG